MPALSFLVGLLGNIIAVFVFASPIGTFREIIKTKSIQRYKSTPYIITLLSTSLWVFYGLLKPGGLLIYSVNGIGSVFEVIYVSLFLIYAPKDKRISVMKWVGSLNIGAYGVFVGIAMFALHGSLRLTVVGFVCALFTIGMYAAPLGAMRNVVRTKSVEYMPFFLSFFLFLNAGVWTFYAVLVKDYYVGVPNLIGLFLGLSQLILYAVYRKGKKTTSTSDDEVNEEKGSRHLVTNDDLEMQTSNSTKSKNTSLYKELSLPKRGIPMENVVNKSKITKAKSLSSYELQAIVHSSKEDDDVPKKY
ncbi:unnamed protein product [Rhodiola kirilowii]